MKVKWSLITLFFLTIAVTSIFSCTEGVSPTKKTSNRHLNQNLIFFYKNGCYTFLNNFTDDQRYKVTAQGVDLYITDSSKKYRIEFMGNSAKSTNKPLYPFIDTDLNINRQNLEYTTFKVPYFRIDREKFSPQNLTFARLNVDSILVSNEGALNFLIANSFCNALTIFSPRDLGSEEINFSVLPLITFEGGDTHSPIGKVTIYYRQLGLVAAHSPFVSIFDCSVDSSQLGCYNTDTLQLDNIKPKKNKSMLSLLTDNKVTLKLKRGNFTFLNFDYSKFQYFPGDRPSNIKEINTWYSSAKKHYGELIQSQRNNNDQEGIRLASIDSSKFEDSQIFFTRICIPLKVWWNNYGYDKTKVVQSSLELFFLVWVLNFAFFKYVIHSYPFDEIIFVQRKHLNSRPSVESFFTTAYLSLIFSGFLFFGLKLELNKLKLSSPLVSIWIIVQYTAGIISIAYIANLIITK